MSPKTKVFKTAQEERLIFSVSVTGSSSLTFSLVLQSYCVITGIPYYDPRHQFLEETSDRIVINE
jgi:hypothetical protein